MFFRLHEQSKKQTSQQFTFYEEIPLSLLRTTVRKQICATKAREYTRCLWHTFMCQNASEAIGHLISYTNQMQYCTPKTKTIPKVRQRCYLLRYPLLVKHSRQHHISWIRQFQNGRRQAQKMWAFIDFKDVTGLFWVSLLYFFLFIFFIFQV